MKQLGEFNRLGPVEAQQLKDAEVGDTGLEGRVRLGDEVGSDEEVEIAAFEPEPELAPEAEPETKTASDEPASDSEAGEEGGQVDEDGDGHDDRNGQFVDGNQEAAG